jgi:hypothetical protein
MDQRWKEVLWRQYGAAMGMLENALRSCPVELWRARLYRESKVRPEFAEFWFIAYHALFWLDFYLSETAEGFAPPAPFTLSEFEAGLLPERVYTQEELLAYLEYGRNKCRSRLESLADEMAIQRCRPDWPEMTVAELLIDNLRHVQEHASQLNLMLGQNASSPPGWITTKKADG